MKLMPTLYLFILITTNWQGKQHRGYIFILGRLILMILMKKACVGVAAFNLMRTCVIQKRTVHNLVNPCGNLLDIAYL